MKARGFFFAGRATKKHSHLCTEYFGICNKIVIVIFSVVRGITGKCSITEAQVNAIKVRIARKSTY